MAQVYLIDKTGHSEPMTRIRCKDENEELQQLLNGNFELLPGDQIDPDDPRRWLLVKREMPVPDPSTGVDRWSVDFFFVDQDATPTFVECKRRSDTRSRREIVGQMLEYAANGHHYWTRELLVQFAEATAHERGSTLDAALQNLRPADDLPTDEFFQNVEGNLRSGQLRIIFFLEDSAFELRSVVDFLNRQMQFSEVLLVEARQYLAGEQRIVVPTLFGYTEQARLVKRSAAVGSSGARRRWDREAFFADAAARLSDAEVLAVTKLYDAAVSLSCELTWGTGERTGSFNVKDSALCQRSLFSVYSNGRVSLNFAWLNETDREETIRHRFIQLAVERLVLPPADYRDKYQKLLINDWFPKVEQMISTLRSLVGEFRSMG